MALINEDILDQTFELVREALVVILQGELDNQAIRQPDAGLSVKVFEERSIKADAAEGTIVNILFVSDTGTQKTPLHKVGDFIYYIDVWTTKKFTDTERGDTLSRKQNQRILGVIRGILEASVYYSLGFTTKFIHKTEVTMIEVELPDNRPDGANVAMGRLQFNAKCSDTNVTEGFRELTDVKAQFKIGDTDKGHLFIKEV